MQRGRSTKSQRTLRKKNLANERLCHDVPGLRWFIRKKANLIPVVKILVVLVAVAVLAEVAVVAALVILLPVHLLAKNRECRSVLRNI
jgi:hypothetical protein